MEPSAVARPPVDRWRAVRRRFNRFASRVDFYPRLELAVFALTIVLGVSSYAVLTGQRGPATGFSPPLVTLLLVANLLPLMALLVLIARRVAILLSNRRQGMAGARLHVRLVAVFAAIAAVPTLLVVVFASLLFQFGSQFWFSDRVKTVLDNADQVAQAYVRDARQRFASDLPVMAADVSGYGRDYGFGSKTFSEGLLFQLAGRRMEAAAVFSPTANGYRTYAAVKMDERPLAVRIKPAALARARAGQPQQFSNAPDRMEAVVRLEGSPERYLYVSAPIDAKVVGQVTRTQTALSDYRNLTDRSRALQWRFNAILIVVSLLILAAAIWFALWLATRLVAPIGRLAVAAERVGGGDLDVRVPVRGSPDELGTLGRAFNRMTGQLKAQQTALIGANAQLDERRRFSEAVLSGVSAGVLSIDGQGVIRLVNRSAARLLETDADQLSGRKLAQAVPQLAALLREATTTGVANGQVRIARGAETQTLAVRIAAEAGGARSYVLTFDDISAQLADQRRAAWADVARRIAHEIKNPLTPIQLSAERLQRKYGAQIDGDRDVFASLTSTIVRQVGDLRRMVDEFSSFARSPKPVFRAEPLAELARQALFMQEIAHPAIAFAIDAPEPSPVMVCDRRQLAQALTNLLKNAAEAVAARLERDDAPGHVWLSLAETPGKVTMTVADDGIGLPQAERNRLTEPYMTTRAKGTGLGLAIVEKIVEEHEGRLELADRPGGGACIRIHFDIAALAARLDDEDDTVPLRQMQG